MLDLGEYKLLWGVAALDMFEYYSPAPNTPSTAVRALSEKTIIIDLSDKINTVVFSNIVQDENYHDIIVCAPLSNFCAFSAPSYRYKCALSVEIKLLGYNADNVIAIFSGTTVYLTWMVIGK